MSENGLRGCLKTSPNLSDKDRFVIHLSAFEVGRLLSQHTGWNRFASTIGCGHPDPARRLHYKPLARNRKWLFSLDLQRGNLCLRLFPAWTRTWRARYGWVATTWQSTTPAPRSSRCRLIKPRGQRSAFARQAERVKSSEVARNRKRLLFWDCNGNTWAIRVSTARPKAADPPWPCRPTASTCSTATWSSMP